MKKNKDFEAQAISRYVRVSPAKIRRILNQLRGRSYEEVVIILKFMPHKVCRLIFNVIYSAVSNAKNVLGVDDFSFFYILEARVDDGPFLKRIRPHAQGRAFPIKKRMSHIVIKIGKR
uniref:ribosomal protein L22 n=1 Tax=Phacus arnoldii TaxID=298292 RepID=UPI0023AA513E|nr:ribosomal protein L22 [Phacus arnoldii]WCH63572.1 ribosomal protein L22 [Phacus arnoldii]